MLRALVEFRIRGVKASYNILSRFSGFNEVHATRPIYLSSSVSSPTTSSLEGKPGQRFVIIASEPLPEQQFN